MPFDASLLTLFAVSYTNPFAIFAGLVAIFYFSKPHIRALFLVAYTTLAVAIVLYADNNSETTAKQSLIFGLVFLGHCIVTTLTFLFIQKCVQKYILRKKTDL